MIREDYILGWIKRLIPAYTLVANNVLGNGYLNQFGIIPRRLASQLGVLWAPFLDCSFTTQQQLCYSASTL
jgi:hypothetical protein